MGILIEKNQRDMLEAVENFIRTKEHAESVVDGFQVVHDVAKPHYNIGGIVEVYRSFFDETETINKKYQI